MRRDRVLVFLIPILLSACAQVGVITGGEKDTEAPLLITSSPVNGSTNFVSNSIVLEFNERIQLDRVRERMLISPPLDILPDVRISGAKRITIQLNTPLRPNTTYSFLIGEAVKDLTEGNLANGVAYVVSTGDHLDSLQLNGTVKNAFTGKPAKNALVMIYDQRDTTTIRSGRPAYATRALDDGTYHLNYLGPGEYRLYALQDQNANYRFDLPNEEVAFKDEPVLPIAISPDDTLITLYDLHLFQERSAVQQVREAKVIPDGALRIVFAKPAEQATLSDLTRTGGTLKWSSEWSATRDTVLFWPNDTTNLSEGSYELRTDVILDTLSYRIVKKMPFFTGLRTTANETADSAVVFFNAERPLISIDQERVSVKRDSIPIAFTLKMDSNDPRKFILKSALEKGDKASVTLLPKAVTDIYGGHNDTLVTGLGRAAEKTTGSLRLKLVHGSHYPLIVQLFSGQDVLVRENISDLSKPIKWERLTPGIHSLRVIEDRNGNGHWDTGELDSLTQPERILTYPEPVNVRAAWDIGLDWTIP